MKRRLVSIFAVMLLATGLVAAESLETLLDKVYEARGGLKNLQAVESSRMSGTLEIVGMMQVPITMEWKRPDKLRIEFTTPQGPGVQAFDGKIAWQAMPGTAGAAEVSGDDAANLRRQSDLFDGPLVGWKSKGHSVTYIGQEDLDGTTVHKLGVKLADGTEQTVFIDAGSFLPVHQSGVTKAQGMETEVETFVGDYKKVGKLMMPHRIKSELIDVGLTQSVTLDSIELDVKLTDDRFSMPVATTASE